MEGVNIRVFMRKLREVVDGEPKAFAYNVGLSLSAVYSYLAGRIPATRELFKIARHTGHSMEWFLTDEVEEEQGRKIERFLSLGTDA